MAESTTVDPVSIDNKFIPCENLEKTEENNQADG